MKDSAADSWQSRARFALLGVLASIALTVGPLAFIYRGIPVFNHWQVNAMVAISIVASALSGLFGFGIIVGEKETRRQRHLIWITAVAGFLYVATAALCERLGVASFREAYWRDIGLAVFSAGCLLRLWSIAALGHLHSGLVTIQKEHKLIAHGPYKYLRHPSYLGVLLISIGLPLVFGTWFPLIALPGIMVAVKWRINDEDALLKEHFGDDFERYKKNRWRLIPFLY